jgi:coenzyme F420 biosynthesis associated uncharacterized protein
MVLGKAALGRTARGRVSGGPSARVRPDRGWQIGFALGAAVALTAAIARRRADRVAKEGLVDWERAEAIAVRRLQRAPGSLSAEELRASEPVYDAAMQRIVPLLEERLGRPLPGVVERYAVVDRAGWARANLVTFKHLVGRLEESLLDRMLPRNGGLGHSLATLANRFVTTQQIGFLLGYLGGRVLGQYDVALLSAEAEPGRLLFVEENIRSTATALNVPLDDFRVWIALHETTHAFELEAHPWVRPYLADRLERQLAAFIEEARAFQVEGVVRAMRSWRRAGDEPFAGLLSPEQRRLLRETQRAMSVLEGFGDWVMDELGAQLIPDVKTIRERFDARRAQRRRGLDRLIARLIGLDMKLEQYRLGERFVVGVAALGGRDAIDRLWEGPDSLPTEEELQDPQAWVRRVVPHALPN